MSHSLACILLIRSLGARWLSKYGKLHRTIWVASDLFTREPVGMSVDSFVWWCLVDQCGQQGASAALRKVGIPTQTAKATLCRFSRIKPPLVAKETETMNDYQRKLNSAHLAIVKAIRDYMKLTGQDTFRLSDIISESRPVDPMQPLDISEALAVLNAD